MEVGEEGVAKRYPHFYRTSYDVMAKSFPHFNRALCDVNGKDVPTHIYEVPSRTFCAGSLNSPCRNFSKENGVSSTHGYLWRTVVTC